MDLTPDELQRWTEDGVLLRAGAVPETVIDRYRQEVVRRADRLLARASADEDPTPAGHPGSGLIDPYAVCAAAREALLGPDLVAVLRRLIGAPPLLLAATETAAGAPDPGPYRDPTYVAVSEPATLIGMAVGLGEATLPCHPGSHRLPAESFSGRYRHFNPERDGEHALREHREHLVQRLAEHDLGRETLTLHAGDVALWSGELVHEAVEGDALVAQVCAVSAEPGWFTYRPERAARVAHGGAWLASQHYDLDDDPELRPADASPRPAAEADAPPPPPGPAPPPELDTVQAELERAGGSTPAPRRGGLLGAVRGLMRRDTPR